VRLQHQKIQLSQVPRPAPVYIPESPGLIFVPKPVKAKGFYSLCSIEINVTI